MSRGRAVLGVLLLGAALGVAYPVLTSTQDVADPLAVDLTGTSLMEGATTASEPFAKTTDCSTDEQASTLEASGCGRCPPEQPRCNRDRDCDSVCGGKGTGVCEQINSCFKCCTCGGTT